MVSKDPLRKNTTPKATDPEIFVQIASYRDPECQYTVRDLFEQAAQPDRVQVGICWQYDPEADNDCFCINTREDQVRIAHFDWRESQGVCWARHQVQQLWQGEPYTLMIDSHMRFTPEWDKALLAELGRCPAKKPLLTGSPASYIPPDQLSSHLLPTIRRAQMFNAAGEMRFRGAILEREAERPLNGAFIAAGFIFASSNVIEEVPYDPYLYFNHEEASLAARLYTHGWDVFHPSRQFLYHYYRDPEIPPDRPLHNKDMDIQAFNKRSLSRYRHVTGQAVTEDMAVRTDLDLYGLGSARSLDDFEDYCGLDFKSRKASEKALRCSFIKELNKYVRRIYVPELDDVKPNPLEAEATARRKAALPQRREVNTHTEPPLESGAFLPLFELPDHDGNLRKIHFYGGHPIYLFFLPPDEEKLAHFFNVLKSQQQVIHDQRVYKIFILSAAPRELSEWRSIHDVADPLWGDIDGMVARRCGLAPGEMAAFLTNENLQVLHAAAMDNPEKHLPGLVEEASRLLARPAPQLARRHAPVLVVENAISPQLITETFEYWENGRKYEGKVGAVGSVTLRKDAKVRTDCFIHDRALLEKLDRHFIRTLFPEIEKVYNTFVTHREDYKLGCYPANGGGFFKMHRDNYERRLGYRRQALVLLLNDDFEGGHLTFPEYGLDYYRPATGSAVVFPCSLTHQVTKITSGNRYVLVSFFYDEEAAKHRVNSETEEGAIATIDEWRVIPVRDDPHASRSRFDNIARNKG